MKRTDNKFLGRINMKRKKKMGEITQTKQAPYVCTNPMVRLIHYTLKKKWVETQFRFFSYVKQIFIYRVFHLTEKWIIKCLNYIKSIKSNLQLNLLYDLFNLGEFQQRYWWNILYAFQENNILLLLLFLFHVCLFN